MQTYFEKIPLTGNSALYIKELKKKNFDAPRHFHPEYEIMLVMASAGKRFVGDNLSDYQPRDLVLLGPDLPHYWFREESQSNEQVHALVIQFAPDFPGAEFLSKLEMREISKMLVKARKGLHFDVDAYEKIIGNALKLLDYQGFERIIRFFSILDTLSRFEATTLVSEGYQTDLDNKDSEKINKVYKYILENYTGEINFSEAAQMVHMNKTSFCHYFKKRTRKKFSDFVNEVRIGRAARLLLETSKNVTEIGYECGYKNMANFNRRFKEIKGMTPSGYRRLFNQEHIAPNASFLA